MSSTAIVSQYLQYMSTYDFEGLNSIFAPNFKHEFRPASLNGMGSPVRNAAQLVDWLKELKSNIVALHYSAPVETIVAEGVVVVHVHSEGDTPALGKSFPNEHLFIFHISGGKITSIKEFMDSKFVAQLAEEGKKAGRV
ncbi:hypothetical protein H0H93_014015 [Arthromyces matolae]|nr:hypothetical protein H0H93_014015 [Arthromyces matolae]